MYLILTLCCVLPSAFGTIDELISARCQAQCLHNFEHSTKHSDSAVRRRQLKHMIIQLCRADDDCSACARPCVESFTDLKSCHSLSCQGVASPKACYKSCDFIDLITRHKPGACPSATVREQRTANECVAYCRRDSDCATTEKCCTSGCNSQCVPPVQFGEGLLPRPTEVTVAERKRGRSAVIRWVMTAMRPEHASTFATLYLVQWKWGVREAEQYMTGWETVTVRTKPFAILKHLLSPGRYYLFRIAAVNVNGTIGYSTPSAPFRLSRDPKPPKPPTGLTPGRSYIETGRIRQEIHWEAPISDLPIAHYQITWSLAPNDTRMAMLNDAPSDGGEMGSGEDMFPLPTTRRTALVPGDHRTAVLHALQPSTRYLVEVHAIGLSADADEENWHGERAAIYLVTKRVESVENEEIPTLFESVVPDDRTDSEQSMIYEPYAEPQLDSLAADKPYFQNGLLKAFIKWRYSGPGKADKSFRVVWWPLTCEKSPVSEYSSPRVLEHVVHATSFELYDLQFDCHYAVNVSLQSDHTIRAQHRFHTPRCQDAPVDGSVVPNCPTVAPDIPSKVSDLLCLVVPQSQKHNITAGCRWSAAQTNQITAFRVVSAQATADWLSDEAAGDDLYRGLDRNTMLMKILNVNQPSIRLTSLQPDRRYVVQVQAVSSAGLGPAARTSFVTPMYDSGDAAPPTFSIDLSSDHLISTDPRPALPQYSSCCTCTPWLIVLLLADVVRWILL